MGILGALSVAVAAGMMALGEDKSGTGILLSVYAVLVYLVFLRKNGLEKTNTLFLYVILATIPFPYLIQFQGKDALTVTTVLILFHCASQCAKSVTTRFSLQSSPRSSGWWLAAAIAASFTATLAANPYFMAQSIRHYLAHISGILLFFIIIRTLDTRSKLARACKVVLAVLVLQALGAVFQQKAPGMVRFLDVFGTRTDQVQGLVIDGINRSTGTVWDYELLAEMFLAGSIIAIYLVFETGSYLYIGGLLAILAGMLFTKTRSDIMLFVAAFVLIFVFLKIFRKDPGGIMARIAIVTVACAAGMLAVFPEQASELIGRLQTFFSYHAPISAEAINRKEVWANALTLLRHPALLGKGLFNVEMQYSWAGSFHSLYMTLLYKVGYLGLCLHVLFWAALLKAALARLTARPIAGSW